MTSFKVSVITPGDRDYTSNALRFATHDEAQEYGEDLALRWTAIEDWRVDASDEPVTVTLDAEGRYPTVRLRRHPEAVMTKAVIWAGDPESCDLCGHRLQDHFIDGKTRSGPWGTMCLLCFEVHGTGLGTGQGQLYQRQGADWVKTAG